MALAMKKGFISVLACLFLCALVGETRRFTDTEGRSIEATLIEADASRVRIQRTSDLRFFEIPLTMLSSTDREYVRLWTEKQNRVPSKPQASVAETSQAQPTSPQPFPQKVKADDYEVEVIEEDTRTETFIYRSAHFEFRSNVKLARAVVREFAAIFEDTFAAVEQLPMLLKPGKPKNEYYITQLYETKEQYYADGGIPGSGGSYFGGEGKIKIPLTSLGVKKSSSSYSIDRSNEDHTTLIHEITHQVMHPWLRPMPVWLTEGFAVYMENIPYDRNVFRFDRFKVDEAVGRSRRLLDAKTMMTMTSEQWLDALGKGYAASNINYSSAWVYTLYFLHLDGEGNGQRIFDYLRAIEARTPHSEAEAILLDGRSYSELEEAIERAYKRERVDIEWVRAS